MARSTAEEALRIRRQVHRLQRRLADPDYPEHKKALIRYNNAPDARDRLPDQLSKLRGVRESLKRHNQHRRALRRPAPAIPDW